ncbi:hypothetical protein A2U01_0025149, partial [Trifolium medium]|nr:hypothetical protein [Trifolium medium]
MMTSRRKKTNRWNYAGDPVLTPANDDDDKREEDQQPKLVVVVVEERGFESPWMESRNRLVKKTSLLVE